MIGFGFRWWRREEGMLLCPPPMGAANIANIVKSMKKLEKSENNISMYIACRTIWCSFN
jgi:hypothetical protein